MNSDICFHNDNIELINHYIAEKIDLRLFLFANYCPKQAPVANQSTKYIYSITNTYGLIFDCAKYYVRSIGGQESLLNVLKKFDCVSADDFEFSINFVQSILSQRSLLAHNSTQEDSMSRENLKQTLEYYSKIIQVNVDASQIETIADVEINEGLYKKINDEISRSGQLFSEIILKAMSKVAAHTQKKQIISSWTNLISIWYQSKDDFLKNALIDWYLYNRADVGLYPTPFDVRQWVSQTSHTIKAKLPQLINEQVDTIQQVAFPQTLFWRMLNHLNPTLF